MAAFSRLQLAKALIEYDNDPENPDAEYRSANQSAIFAPARRSALVTSQQQRSQTPDHLRLRLPSDAPKNAASTKPEAQQVVEEEPEVDLASWGLDTYIKPQKRNRPRANSESLLSRDKAHAKAVVDDTASQFDKGRASLEGLSMPSTAGRRAPGARSMSSPTAYNNYDIRRRSFASPLDLIGMQGDHRPISMIQDEFSGASPQPLTEEPAADDDNPFSVPTSSRISRLRAAAHARTMSDAILSPKQPTQDENPFAVPPPPVELTSRFDPKAMRARTSSINTFSQALDEHQFALPHHGLRTASPAFQDDDPYSVPQASRSDMRGPRARTLSNASLGSRLPFDVEEPLVRPSMSKRDSLRYSKLDLMRPKVLIMPAPLHGEDTQVEVEPPGREGFLMSKDGPPLPFGARTRPASGILLPTSNSSSSLYTPNPRSSMTLSQLTFRNSLMVGGQRDVSYSDLEQQLPRAQEDGQQVQLPALEEEDLDGFHDVERPEPGKPAGKLYGRSLIDDLEARKAQIRSKSRTFMGDQRPSMMQRGSTSRISTLIDPETLRSQPDAQLAKDAAGKRLSNAPLLEFGENSGKDVPKSRSVFGVDQLWERELEKLKAIEEVERQEEEERKKQEEAKASRKRKGKGPDKNPQEQSQLTPERVAAAAPPVLPNPVLPRARPPPVQSDSESEDDDNLGLVARPRRRESMTTLHTLGAKGWFGSSDEDEPRHQSKPQVKPPAGQVSTSRPIPRPKTTRRAVEESDSDDVPLAAQLRKAGTQPPAAQDTDSDEEVPLAALLEQSKLSLPPLALGGNLSKDFAASSDDDDVPLALRRQTQAPRGSDDDDQPLGLRRASQFPGGHPMAFMQPQVALMTPQQMLMQAQLQHSMQFPQTPMGMPLVTPMSLMAPTPINPGMLPDATKFGLVDRWRHDVATGDVS